MLVVASMMLRVLLTLGSVECFVPRKVVSRLSSPIGQAVSHQGLCVGGSTEDFPDESAVSIPAHIAQEMNSLQYQLSLIGALEERNRAQLDSFIDEEDQWNSLDNNEKELLQSKDKLEERMEELLSVLVSDWMGQKSLEG